MESVLRNYTMFKTGLDQVQLEYTESGLNFSTSPTFGFKTDNTTEIEDDGFTDSVWLWTIVDGLLMLVILAGNTLTILAVTLSRRLSSLISNQFVLNLAISDLTVGLTLPYHLAFYLNLELGRVKSTCVLRFILITLACCASILNLIAIAVDRYIAILHPLHYSRYMSKGVTRALMAVGWSVAVGVSVVPIFWNTWGRADSCDMHKVIPKEYTTNILAPMFSLIWLVMFVLYWRIWHEASQHAKRMRTLPNSSTQGPNDWKSVQVVFMVLGSFSVCWMPYVVVVCTQALAAHHPDNQVLYKAVFSLAMANSGINPIIYAWKNHGFRKAFKRLLRCKNPDCPEFERSFTRNSPPQGSQQKKLPLETISRKDTQASTLAREDTINIETEKDTKILVKKDPETSSAINNKNDKNAKSLVKNGAEPSNVINNNKNDKCAKSLVKKDTEAPSVINNNKNDKCRIIENLAYDGGVSDSEGKCHIIENLGFEDTLDAGRLSRSEYKNGRPVLSKSADQLRVKATPNDRNFLV